MSKHSWIFLFFSLLLLTGGGSNCRIFRSNFVDAFPRLDGNGFNVKATSLYPDYKDYFIKNFETPFEQAIRLPDDIGIYIVWNDSLIIANTPSHSRTYKGPQLIYSYNLYTHKKNILLEDNAFEYADKKEGYFTMRSNWQTPKARYKLTEDRLVFIDSVSYNRYDNPYYNGHEFVMKYRDSLNNEDSIFINTHPRYYDNKGMYFITSKDGWPNSTDKSFLTYRPYTTNQEDTIITCNTIKQMWLVPNSNYMLVSCILSDGEYHKKTIELGEIRGKYAEENPDVISCFPTPPEGTWKLYDTKTKQFFDTGELSDDVTISGNGKNLLFIKTEEQYREYSVRTYSIDELTKPKHLVTQ